MVSIHCYKNNKKWIRTCDNFKNKFEKIDFMKKPAIIAEILLNLLRAKEIKKEMSSNKMIRYCDENQSDFVGVTNSEHNLESVAVSKSFTAAIFHMEVVK